MCSSDLGKMRYLRPPFFTLGGTPLNETIVLASEIVNEFKKHNRLQIVNTVFLTDGEGERSTDIWTSTGGRDYSSGASKVLVIRDPVTKQEAHVYDLLNARELTAAYIKLFKARTNCNVIGFYVLFGRELNKHVLGDANINDVEMETIRSQFRKDKYKVITSAGYDEYYLLRSEGMDTEEDAEFVVKENATNRQLATAFKKFSAARKSNRVVLNRFINMIA